MKRIKFVLLLLMIGVLPVCADGLATGEWAWLYNGEPAMIGQSTNDHLFTRNSYYDEGTIKTYDNVVSFKSGKVQTVWFWLDDDEIYLNNKVQALTPVAINSAGELYNEITYNSLAVEVYLPMNIQIVTFENSDGDEVAYEQGNRMPNTTDFAISEKGDTKIVDGKEYRVYSIVLSNLKDIGCHFSSKNANMYKTYGALKKDDAPLFAIHIQNNNQNQSEGHIDQDMIIANLEFGFREGLRDGWTPNEYRFIYGTGGNNFSQRFQFYNRVSLYGSQGIGNEVSNILATSIELDRQEAELNVGETLKLNATVLPNNATNKSVAWVSSNSAVATVNGNGEVTAISPGVATITARTTDGTNLRSSCIIRVKEITDDLSDGELAWLPTGEAATVGQTTYDHLFVRNSYNDMGPSLYYDNIVSFKSGNIQTVWVWLDDDEIYLNDKVQALTPMPINSAGDLYNEITYNSLQCEVYLPMSMRMIQIVNEEGDVVAYEQGDRMPNTTDFSFSEKAETKVVDGKEYRVYAIVLSNFRAFGSHFSSRNASMYKANGALKKDDAPLFGIFIQNDNQVLAEGRVDDMIIANIEFGFREGVAAGWDPNDYRFIYGTGGNNKTQRFQFYNRVALYGSKGFDDEQGNTLATSINLNQSYASVSVGDSLRLFATVLPEDATNKNVVWTSSNPTVATVSTDGLVTALKAGEATIIAKTTDGTNLSATCQVVVNNVMAATISLNTSEIVLEIDETSQLIATVYPNNTTNKVVTWRSSNTLVATVNSNGVVTAKSPGIVIITATTTDGSNLSATCKVTVTERKATSIVLNTNNLSLYVNQTANLTATIYPSDAGNKTVTWKSSNTAVATVNDNGLVKAISAGNAIVTATTTDGSNLSASCSVKVSIIPVTSISLNQTNLTLDVSETYQLVASIQPSNATYQTVTWTSSNSSVARVSDTGLITPVSPGTITIKAKTTDGTNLSASCQVTVVKRVKAISLNQSSLILTLPETAQLVPLITPSDATNKALQWTSSNTGVASVDNNGYITSVNPGTATIKATTTDGSNLSATCQLTVIKQYVTSITLSESKLVMHLGETAQLIADVEPYNASNKVLSWSSGNTSIARVDNNGLVTAISDGTTYIRATATDGSNVYANCTVEVLPDYYITLDTLSHIRGSSTQVVDLPVTLINKNLISGIQFDVSLPNDVSFNFVDGVPDVWLDDARKTRSHSISASLLNNGKYRVLVTSSSSKNLKGNDGVLVHMNLLMPQMHNTGNRNIYISDIIASEADETRHALNNTSTSVRFYYIVGDADANAIVDIADHAATASKILGKSPSPFYSDAANVDNNYSLDVVDLVGITNIALELKPITIRQAPIRGGVENRIFCEVLRLNADDEREINLGIVGDFNFAGFQMDLQLPRGLELIEATLGEDAANLGLVTALMPDGKIRLLGTSFSDDEVDGVCPKLLKLRLKADRYYLPGTDIEFSDILFAERNLNSHSFDASCIEYVEPSSVYELIDDIRIYVENSNIIVDTPVEGHVQLIAVDGRIVDEYFVQVGHNVYPTDVEGIYIIHFKDKAIKVRF